MPRFVFTLAPVLRQRLAVERVAMAKVADLERERASAESLLSAAQRGISSARDDLRELLGASMVSKSPADPRRAGLQARASLALDMNARRLAIALAGIYAKLTRAKQELARACVDRRAVELLRERQLELWKREQAAIENNMIDEVATRLVYNASLTEGRDSATTQSTKAAA
jgi:flagellar biosynthesis chaperone FliJ